MSFFPGYDFDDFGAGSGWPWGFASTPRGGGGYSYVDPYERRRAYYPGRESFHMPSQNHGRRVPPHARGPVYEYEVPISDRAQARDAHLKKQNAYRPRSGIDDPAAHVKKHAAPQVTRIIPISEPAKAPRFVAKEDAANKIQSVFRGYSVRHTKPLCSLRKIAETKRKLLDFKNQVSDPEKMRLVRENMKERVVLTEGVMNLLLQLDSIQGALPIVREIRKATVREIVQLQERIDSILQQKEPSKSALESSEGANGEREKSSESALESSEGINGEMELGEELEESNKQMEVEQVPVKAGDESMETSACDNAEAGQQEAGLNIVDENVEAGQNTGADNVEAAQDTGAVNISGDSLESDDMVEAAQDSEKVGDDDMGDHEAAQNTGDNLEAAQDTGAVNVIDAHQMAQAQDSDKDAGVMCDIEQFDQDVLKTQSLSPEATDGEKLKQGIQDGVEATTQDEDASAMEVEGECRRIVDAMVDEAVHEAEAAEVCASRKREREENEEQEARKVDAGATDDKADADEYMKIMVRLVDENAQLKKLVTECLKQTELQNALICHLNDRVQKLEKKAKRNCNKKKDAKLPDLF